MGKENCNALTKSRCTVPNCTNTNKESTLFTFPRNVLRYSAWMRAINNRHIQGLAQTDVVKRKLGVCKFHFKEGDVFITNNGVTKLIGEAVPEKNLPGEEFKCTCNIDADIPRVIEKESHKRPTTTVHDKDEGENLHKKIKANTSPTQNKIMLLRQQILDLKKQLYNKNRIIKRYQDAKKDDIELKNLRNSLKNLNSTQSNLVNMMLKNVNKRSNGARYSTEEKILALSLYKQSPAIYRLQNKMFGLPSESSLKSFVAEINIKSEIDDCIKKKIEEASKQQNEDDLNPVLPDLHYNVINEEIVGSEE